MATCWRVRRVGIRKPFGQPDTTLLFWYSDLCNHIPATTELTVPGRIFIYLSLIFMHNNGNEQPCQCLLVAMFLFVVVVPSILGVL